MYKLSTSGRRSDDFSNGLDRDRNRRQRELTNNKNQKGKYHVRILLKDIFGLVEHEERVTFGSGYKVTLKRKSDNSVLNKDNTINNGKIETNALESYVLHYTPSIPQQARLSKQILIKTATELQNVEISNFMKEVKTEKLWTLESGAQERIKVPIWNIVGFKQRDWQDLQSHINDTSYRPPITSTHFNIGSEKLPDSAILSNFEDDDYSPGCGRSKEAFRALTKNNRLNPFISDQFFVPS